MQVHKFSYTGTHYTGPPMEGQPQSFLTALTPLFSFHHLILMAKAHVRFGQAEQFRPPPYNHFRLNSGPKTYDSLLFSLDLFLIKISSSGGGEPCDPFNGSSWWEETGVHFWLLLQVFDHHNIIRCKIGQWTMEMIKINVYCTLCRQYWTDQRLSFNSNVIDELTMNWQVESKTSQSVLLVAVYI